jgi:hypothetical protein
MVYREFKSSLYEKVFNPNHLFNNELHTYFEEEGYTVTIHDFTVDLTSTDRLTIVGGDYPKELILENKQGTFYLKDKHVRRIASEPEFLKEVIDSIVENQFFRYFEKRA